MTKAKPNELRIVRVYDAPLDLVWDAWTDPEQVAKWWGPRGFSITTHSKDLRSGGTWVYTMHGPDGTDYPNKTLYHEVIEKERLVYDHGGNDDRPALFKVVVNFGESRGKTVMEMTMSVKSEEELTLIKKIIKDAGGNSTWDRLAEYLFETNDQRDCLVIHRTFPAGIEKVFQNWVVPEEFASWVAPQGMESKIIASEVSAGKETRYRVSNASGFGAYGSLLYSEIDPPQLIRYVQVSCDVHGKPTKNPLTPSLPSEFSTTVIFESEGDNETRVKFLWEPTSTANVDERKAFVENRYAMNQGWSASFDRLESKLQSGE